MVYKMCRDRVGTECQIEITILTPEVAVVVSGELVEFGAPPDGVLKLLNKRTGSIAKQEHPSFGQVLFDTLLPVGGRCFFNPFERNT